jgi:hypothetical protein
MSYITDYITQFRLICRLFAIKAAIKERLLCLATSEKFGASDLADVSLEPIQNQWE